jgi:hypothetical protein
MHPVAQSMPRGSPRRASLTASAGVAPKDQKEILLEQQYIRQQIAAEQEHNDPQNGGAAISMQALNGMHPSSQMKILQLQQTLFGNTVWIPICLYLPVCCFLLSLL